MRTWLRLLTITALLGCWIAVPPSAAAYSWSSAVAYAEAHWSACGNQNPSCPCFSGDDCTNFVSQSLHAGGYPFRSPYTGSTDDHHWWIRSDGHTPPNWSYTRSWSTSQNLYNFLILDIPGGTLKATYRGDSTLASTAIGAGDVYFYDWDYYMPNGVVGINHASINVGFGTTLDGHYGDYVDAHSNYRHKAFWTLEDYNTVGGQYTKIYAVHVSSSN